MSVGAARIVELLWEILALFCKWLKMKCTDGYRGGAVVEMSLEG